LVLNGKEITSKDGIRVEKDVNKDKYSIVIPKVTAVGSVRLLLEQQMNLVYQKKLFN
jgi:hypothetical protein